MKPLSESYQAIWPIVCTVRSKQSSLSSNTISLRSCYAIIAKRQWRCNYDYAMVEDGDETIDSGDVMVDDGDAMVDNGNVTIDDTCASARPDTMPIYIPCDLPKMIPCIWSILTTWSMYFRVVLKYLDLLWNRWIPRGSKYSKIVLKYT